MVTNWLRAMKIFWVSAGMPEGNITDEDQRRFQDANEIFVGAMHNVLYDHLFDMVHMKYAKTFWDYLNGTYGALDACSELYIMEGLHDYKMVGN